jgi:CheY-like chemotaxis protein
MPRGDETILVVDDERMILDVTVETLNRLGYRTLVARNGQEALDVANSYQETIDLCLLDIAMPIMGGVEAYPLLRKIRPNLKVIVCTGFEEELVSHALLSTGVSAILLKPFRPSALAQEIRKTLDQTAASGS